MNELGKEHPPEKEDVFTDNLIRRLGEKMKRDYAGRRMLRDAHPKMHGVVRGPAHCRARAS